jgi:hypothetical protein
MSALVAAVLMVSGCSGPPPNPLGPPVACIESGSEASINDVLREEGAGAEAILCPNAVFSLRDEVRFTARDQQIYTQGRPIDGSRALLRIVADPVITGDALTPEPRLTTAVYGLDFSGIVLESVQIDGARPSLGQVAPREGQALIAMGGNASGQTVRSVVAYDPRSWSVIHFFEGAVRNDVPTCQGGVITGNTIGPAGTPDVNQWADGISLACGNSLVENNVITDATDGAIVVFGAPGSTIRGNTIVAATQTLLGGINMVDWGVTHGSYAGTRVTFNTIDARGALIKVAIGMGPQIWSCVDGTNYGATVTGNDLLGDHMGYGFAVNGVRDWTVSGNTDSSHHVGTPTGGCTTTNSAPAGFQYQVRESTRLQTEFGPAQLTSVLGLFEVGDGAPFGCSNIYPGQRLRAGDSFPSCDGHVTLVLDDLGGLRLMHDSTLVWSPVKPVGADATFMLQEDGNLVLTDATGGIRWTSHTEGNSGTRLQVQNDCNLVLLDSAILRIWDTMTHC